MNENKAYLLTGSKGIGTGSHFFRFWMPYLFHRISHPKHKHAFIPLNRNYKPLGQMTKEHVDYDALAMSHGVVFARDPINYPGIWHNVEGDHYWLYSDDPRTRMDYFKRLETLMTYDISVMKPDSRR